MIKSSSRYSRDLEPSSPVSCVAGLYFTRKCNPGSDCISCLTLWFLGGSVSFRDAHIWLFQSQCSYWYLGLAYQLILIRYHWRINKLCTLCVCGRQWRYQASLEHCFPKCVQCCWSVFVVYQNAERVADTWCSTDRKHRIVGNRPESWISPIYRHTIYLSSWYVDQHLISVSKRCILCSLTPLSATATFAPHFSSLIESDCEKTHGSVLWAAVMVTLDNY